MCVCACMCRGGGRSPQKPQQFADIQAPGDMVVHKIQICTTKAGSKFTRQQNHLVNTVLET